MNLARQLPARLSLPAECDGPNQSCPAICGALYAFNPLGGGKSSGLDASSASSTSTSDQKTTASEGSLAVGPGGKFLEGLDFSGADLSDITISSTDAGAIAGALKTVGQVNTALTDFVNEANTAAVTRQGSLDDLLKQVLDKLVEKDTQEKTGFQSLLISPLFWLGMAGLAVLGIFLWRKR